MLYWDFYRLQSFVNAGAPFYKYNCACSAICRPPCRSRYRPQEKPEGRLSTPELSMEMVRLFLDKGYCRYQEDGGLVPTERGRERLARWQITMEAAQRKIAENNARQRVASLRRKAVRIQQELHAMGADSWDFGGIRPPK